MDNVIDASTPMTSGAKLDQDLNNKPVNEKTYCVMIGSLLYLTSNHPDVMFSVCLCARFQSSPKESHLIAINRIFRYLGVQKISQFGTPKGEISSSLDILLSIMQVIR